MVSIIIPVWNGSKFIDRAVASVVAQTSSEWELLIVDDGSTDDSVEKAKRWRQLVNQHFNEEKIRLFSTGTANSGAQVGRNLAAEHARYEIFAYLDQDDLFFPRRIESIIPFFKKGNYDLVFSPYEIFEKGKIYAWNLQVLWQKNSYVCSSEGDREPPFEVWARRTLQQINISVPLGVVNRRKIYEEVGGFQPGILSGADGILWRRMADRGAQIGFCPIIAGRYYVRPESQARTKRPFSTGGFEIDKTNPSGSNGQYLDKEWFANLEAKRKKMEVNV